MAGCGSGGGVTDGGVVITNTSVTPHPVIMGQATQLSVQATGPNGESLTYHWAQTAPASPMGSFSASTSASTSWTAPTVSSTTPFTFTVTVSDGKATASALVNVYVKTSADPSFVADVQPILDATCTTCHSANGPPGNLPLVSSKSYAALVGVSPTTSCTGHPMRVVPGDPDHSEFLAKIAGNDCSVRMPVNDQTYFDTRASDVTLIRTWILNGAPNN